VIPLLLPALLACAQASADPEDDEGWRQLDAVVFLAGDEPITLSDVTRHVFRLQQRHGFSVSTEAERLESTNIALEELIVLTLEAQAGEDRDANPIEFEERLNRFLDARRQDRPLVDYVDSLEEQGLSPQAERDINKAGYYRSSFRLQGKEGPRPTRDGNVRPGELFEYYRTSADRLLGGAPSFRFQDLVIQVEQVGGAEEARELATELRERLLEGEDFGALHDHYGTTEAATRGVTRMFGPDELPPGDVRSFGEEARVGDVSAVLALPDRREPGKVLGFRVLKLYERIPGRPAPPFATAPAQEALRTWAEDQRDDAWLAVARARLRRTAHLWPALRTGSGPPPPRAGDDPDASDPDPAPDRPASAPGSEPGEVDSRPARAQEPGSTSAADGR
jgi:hypothetical protein